MTISLTIATDSVIPSDMTATAWAEGYALFLADYLDDAVGGDHHVKLGENTDLPGGEYRDLCNRAYDQWCGMSDDEQAEWIS